MRSFSIASRRPSRYLGQEWGSVTPAEKREADYHAVLVYPDTYEIGQANQAIAILYDCLNADERVYCERAYLPWIDMIALMRTHDLPLASLETYTPVRDFDFVGITLPHELCATNVLEFLDLSGIPLHAGERTEDAPLVFGGGRAHTIPSPSPPSSMPSSWARARRSTSRRCSGTASSKGGGRRARRSCASFPGHRGRLRPGTLRCRGTCDSR